MSADTGKMLMDQKIFEMGLPVEVVSVYLLCTGLADTDTELKFRNILAVWNGSEDELTTALSKLAECNIIKQDTENNVTELLNSSLWTRG